jgi:hypothetical protein
MTISKDLFLAMDSYNAGHKLLEATQAFRSRRTNWPILVPTLLLVGSLAIASPARATLPVSSLFWSMYISAYDLRENLASTVRDDLAGQVGKAVQAKMERIEPGRRVLSAPNCIKTNQSGFDRQLLVDLSVKRQGIKLDNQDWNLVIAGGVARNGLFQDRDLQPVVVLRQGHVTDDEIVNALSEFVNRSIVETIRQQRQK